MKNNISIKALFPVFLLCAAMPLPVQGQSLFDDAVSGNDSGTETVAESGDSKEAGYELGGYIRGVYFGGKEAGANEAETKSGYGEASLKLQAKKEDFGDALAEIRFRKGKEFGEDVQEFVLREAYASAYLGPVDIRIGEQIVVWGRADGINPTNGITPQNMIARSSDIDDRRAGNILVRTFINLEPLKIEGIWIPLYRASTLPTSLISFPSGVSLSQDGDYPGSNVKNGAYAAKLNLELSSFDGSVSYFNGYNVSPGIAIESISGSDITVKLKAYRMHVAGADFSAAPGNILGLRGEAAFRKPYGDYEGNIYIPNPDIQYVLGADKDVGDWTFLVQYVGRYVINYEDQVSPASPAELPNYLMGQKNRMFASQQDRVTHSLTCLIRGSLLHETLKLELNGMYNFTTKEFMGRPQLAYSITDALTVTVGGEIYTGAEGTLFETIDANMSAGYVELKASF
ncbi:MAG: hypothetical protein GY754_19245 [bacterium]|nr:hypothetical protein [bacterium]